MIVCVAIAAFATLVARRDDPILPAGPLILTTPSRRMPVVSAACPDAMRCGVLPGMRLAPARLCCPDAIIAVARPARDTQVARELCGHLASLTPHVDCVAAHPDLQIMLDMGMGTAARAASVADQITRVLQTETGFPVALGVARTRTLARLAAACAAPDGTHIVPPAAEAALLATCRVAQCAELAAHLPHLTALGIRTLDQFVRLPAAAVAAVYGADAHAVWHALQGTDRPVARWHAPLELTRRSTFAGPVTQREPVLRMIERLCGQLTTDMQRRGLQAQGVRLMVQDDRARSREASRTLPQPTATAAVLVQTLSILLETLPLTDAITDLAITLTEPGPMQGRQHTLFPPEQGQPERLAPVLRQLATRHGPGCFRQAVRAATATHLPEERVGWMPLGDP